MHSFDSMEFPEYRGRYLAWVCPLCSTTHRFLPAMRGDELECASCGGRFYAGRCALGHEALVFRGVVHCRRGCPAVRYDLALDTDDDAAAKVQVLREAIVGSDPAFGVWARSCCIRDLTEATVAEQLSLVQQTLGVQRETMAVEAFATMIICDALGQAFSDGVPVHQGQQADIVTSIGIRSARAPKTVSERLAKLGDALGVDGATSGYRRLAVTWHAAAARFPVLARHVRAASRQHRVQCVHGR